MNKATFIRRLAARLGQPVEPTERLVNGFFDEVITALCEGEEIIFTNFMVIGAPMRDPITKKNPRTGDEILVPAKRRLRVRTSVNLAQILAGIGSLDGESDLTLKNNAPSRPGTAATVARKAGKA